jgi:RIO kinase 1
MVYCMHHEHATQYDSLTPRNCFFLPFFPPEMQARGASSGAAFHGASHRPNAGGGAASRAARAAGGASKASHAALAPTANNMQRLEARFSARALDDYQDQFGGHRNIAPAAFNAVKVTASRAAAVPRGRDRGDRATVEQVLDPRTRMVLFKMLNRGVFCDIQGCISTGKEANVYYAVRSDGSELAIKVYKTAILVFKDRDRYVVGDSRFQRFCKSNPRKMVKMWAEKEMRNLARLHAADIPCPQPVQLRLHVLAMEFLGTNGVAAPRLKDAGLPPPRMRRAYTEVVLLVRNLYQKCRLVHADLSEYNLLVHDDEIYVIDVSQSVELDHPRAFDFLREDCTHVNDYFRRQGVATLTAKELFDFAVDPGITEDSIDAAVDALMAVAAARPVVPTAEEEVAERVWHQAYIPKKLDEVMHYERDHERLQRGGDTEGIYYQSIAGMRSDMRGAAEKPAVVQTAQAALRASEPPPSGARPEGRGGSRGYSGTEHVCVVSGVEEAQEVAAEATAAPDGAGHGSSDGDSEYGSGGEDGSSSSEWEDRPKISKEDIRAARRENKKVVKEAKAERRKTKVPKHVKRRATKGAKKKR